MMAQITFEFPDHIVEFLSRFSKSRLEAVFVAFLKTYFEAEYAWAIIPYWI